MPFDSFKAFIEDTAAKGQTLFARVKDKNTFTRVVYACFLVGYADGDYDSDEKAATAKLLNEKFPQFELQDIMDTITEADKKLEFDINMGKMDLLAQIGKTKDEDDAELVMQAVVMIGHADGEFDYEEKTVARTIAERMGLNPRNYGLA